MFNATATTEIYTLSLHDALPIYGVGVGVGATNGSGPPAAAALGVGVIVGMAEPGDAAGASPTSGASVAGERDRKSTRLNSSHGYISYAVFCLKKKKNKCRKAYTR